MKVQIGLKTYTPKPPEVPKPATDCSTKNLTYASDIKQIFEQHCTSCHGYGGRADYNFLTVEDVNRAAKNGELLGTIKWEQGFKKMPAHAEKLDDATIGKIECWISNGMK